MIKKLEGIVVSEKNYRETSKIITVLTKEEGMLSFLAKGAKSLKSDLRSNTAKLTHGIFTVYYKENSLSTLTSVDLLHNFKNIKKDIEKISYASFLLDLAEQTSKNAFDEAIYENLIESLNKIDEGYDPLVITNILELKYLDFLGVMPSLDACSICGAKTNIITTAASSGGLICKNCITNEIIVSEKTIKLLRMYYYVDIKKISKLEISDVAKKEINTFLDEYYDRYTGLFLKTKSFLKSLNKLVKK